MNQHLLNLVLALAAGEVVHNAIETGQVRKKLTWLRLTLAGKDYKDSLPFQVDTRTKSYGLSLLGQLGFTFILFIIFSFLDISGNTALWLIVIFLVTSYWVIAIVLDKYHIEIGALTDAQRKINTRK